MTTALAPVNHPTLSVVGENWWDDSEKFALIQRAARMFSSSPLVPEQYQGERGIGSCVIALNMAHRMNADPLMVMQNLFIVYNRPGWSAQFLIACFNQTGRFSPIRYSWSGTEGRDDWGCIAWSTDRETKERIEGPLVTIKTAKDEGWYAKKGSKWQTIPRLMLMYRAASWLVRTHAPELAMGLQTAEEISDVHEARAVVPPPRLNGKSDSDKIADALEGKTTSANRQVKFDELEERIFGAGKDDLEPLAKLIAESDLTDEERSVLEDLLKKAETQFQAE